MPCSIFCDQFYSSIIYRSPLSLTIDLYKCQILDRNDTGDFPIWV